MIDITPDDMKPENRGKTAKLVYERIAEISGLKNIHYLFKNQNIHS